MNMIGQHFPRAVVFSQDAFDERALRIIKRDLKAVGVRPDAVRVIDQDCQIPDQEVLAIRKIVEGRRPAFGYDRVRSELRILHHGDRKMILVAYDGNNPSNREVRAY